MKPILDRKWAPGSKFTVYVPTRNMIGKILTWGLRGLFCSFTIERNNEFQNFWFSVIKGRIPMVNILVRDGGRERDRENQNLLLFYFIY